MTDTDSTHSSSSLPLTPPDLILSTITSTHAQAVKDPRYQRGKIYEIVVLHEDYQNDMYVGSTICPRLSTRFGQHKIESEKEEQTKKLHVLMKMIGMRFFKIVLIEDYPCDNKEELCKREQYHMNLRKPTLNMVRAHRSEDEEKAYQKNYQKNYREENKEENKEAITAYQKIYKEENKVAISAQRKIYQEENRVAISTQKKIYYDENKVAISARQKAYREKNKVAISAQQKKYRAKAKLSYKDKVVLAVKEALALRARK